MSRVRAKATTLANEMRRSGVNGAARMIAGALRTRWTAARTDIRRLRRGFLEFQVRPRLLPRTITHIHGPQSIPYSGDELLVICVVRNGAQYVRPFVEHYTRLGMKHLVFLDNGSTDGTPEILSTFANTTVLRTTAPFSKYENTMKLYLAQRFSKGRWNLCVDIDEFFDYPFSSSLPIGGLLRYLDSFGYTAVVAQMLDMFPAVPLSTLARESDASLTELHRFYDLSAIEKAEYGWSQTSNPAIRMHWGGIRRIVFGTNNGLTKAALVKMDGTVQPFRTWHHASGARMADISCVLRHYPFSSAFYDKVRDAVESGRYGATTSDEYAGYLTALERDPELVLKLDSAREFRGVDALVEEDFLVASDSYRAWARSSAGSGERRYTDQYAPGDVNTFVHSSGKDSTTGPT